MLYPGSRETYIPLLYTLRYTRVEENVPLLYTLRYTRVHTPLLYTLRYTQVGEVTPLLYTLRYTQVLKGSREPLYCYSRVGGLPRASLLLFSLFPGL